MLSDLEALLHALSKYSLYPCDLYATHTLEGTLIAPWVQRKKHAYYKHRSLSSLQALNKKLKGMADTLAQYYELSHYTLNEESIKTIKMHTAQEFVTQMISRTTAPYRYDNGIKYNE